MVWQPELRAELSQPLPVSGIDSRVAFGRRRHFAFKALRVGATLQTACSAICLNGPKSDDD